MRSLARSDWLTSDVWKISGSAFFADLGYQAVVAGLPLFLVLDLHTQVWVYGLALAISYGPGSLIAWVGGSLADRYGHRRIAVAGNALIPLLSLAGFASSASVAVSLFALGWWARNFRTAARRSMLVQSVREARRSRAFGFLHALDVGGGMLAGLYLLVMVASGQRFSVIFLITVAPLVISTVLVASASGRRLPAADPLDSGPGPSEPARSASEPTRAYRGVLIAASLYGFSSYNLGFPILTVAQGTGNAAYGIGAFMTFLGVSAVTGFLFGRWAQATLGELALMGYLIAALGSAALAISAANHLGTLPLYLSVALLGVALGVIETLEPTLISRYAPAATLGGGLGLLTGARSVGLFVANIGVGLLYHLGPTFAYGYSAAVALAGAVLLATIALSNRSRTESRQA